MHFTSSSKVRTLGKGVQVRTPEVHKARPAGEKAIVVEAPWATAVWKGQRWSWLLQSACFRGRKVFALYMLAVIFITCCCQAPLSFPRRQHKLHRSDCVLAFPPPPSICSIRSLYATPYGNGFGSSINCSCRQVRSGGGVGVGWGDAKGPAACCHQTGKWLWSSMHYFTQQVTQIPTDTGCQPEVCACMCVCV